MKLIYLATTVFIFFLVGCNEDKGPSILVIDRTLPSSPVEYNYKVSEGDWFKDNGKWIDARSGVEAANADSVAILEDYLKSR